MVSKIGAETMGCPCGRKRKPGSTSHQIQKYEKEIISLLKNNIRAKYGDSYLSSQLHGQNR